MSGFTKVFIHIIHELPPDADAALYLVASRALDWFRSDASHDDEKTYTQLSLFLSRLLEKTQPRSKFEQFYVETGSLEVRRLCEYLADELDQNMINAEVDLLIEQNKIVNDKESFGYAFLSADEKTKIHDNISRIRKLVESSELSDRKKNALFAKLHKLAKEVDLAGTPTDRFFSFMGDAAFVMGDMAKKAKPFTDEVKDMIKTIGQARSRKEGTALPKGDEVLSLPEPESEIEGE